MHIAWPLWSGKPPCSRDRLHKKHNGSVMAFTFSFKICDGTSSRPVAPFFRVELFGQFLSCHWFREYSLVFHWKHTDIWNPLCQIITNVYEKIIEIFSNGGFIGCDSIIRNFDFFSCILFTPSLFTIFSRMPQVFWKFYSFDSRSST